ncbi:MAG: hypothetical protein WCC92_17030, partial [Candidatus Korobacteraceae bacterium]
LQPGHNQKKDRMYQRDDGALAIGDNRETIHKYSYSVFSKIARQQAARPPQGLKPRFYTPREGAAEAAPLQKTFFETS